MPERTVIDMRPLGAGDGSEGYEVESERSGAWLRKAPPRADGARGRRSPPARSARTSCSSAAASAARCPRVSSRLGELVRTNSESILTVTVPEDYPDDLIKRVAITSSIYPDPNTHIETVTYGDDGDSMRLLYTLLTGDGTRVTRPLKLLGQILRHPGRLAKVLFAKRWSRRTIIILVMQTLDNAIALRPRKGPFGSFWLQTEQDPERPNPTFIPVANEAAEWFAKRTGGIAQSSFMEAMFNIPSTAHILGGAVIAPDPSEGVVDADQRVFGYENLLVCDGSAIPANVGRQPLADDHGAGRARDERRAAGGDRGRERPRRGRATQRRRGTRRLSTAAAAARRAPGRHRAGGQPSGAVAHEHDVPAADQPEVPVLRQVAHDQRLHAGTVAMDGAVAVDERDVVVARAGPDVVQPVAGIQPVRAGAAVQPVVLAFRLTARMGVAPDHVAAVPREDPVVAVAAEQHVVHAGQAAHRAAFVVGMADVMADPRPALVACRAECPGRAQRERRRQRQHRARRQSASTQAHALHPYPIGGPRRAWNAAAVDDRTSVASARRLRAAAQRPPAIAGRICSVSPSPTAVSRPSSTRTSSSLR